MITKSYNFGRDLAEKLLFFILWPFGAFLYSLKDIRTSKASTIIFFLWCTVFGMGFNPVNDAADSNRYTKWFYEYHDTFEQYLSNVSKYFTFETGTRDIYIDTVYLIVKSFSTNIHWVFFIFSIVFGLFYVLNLRRIISASVKHKVAGIIFWLLLFMFCFSNPIFNINGVRFWTASWVAVWIMFKIFVDKRWQFLPLVFVPMIIHGAFFIFAILTLFIFFFNKGHKLWSIIFLISFFVSAISFLDILHANMDKLPKFIQEEVWNYTISSGAVKKISGKMYEAMPLHGKILTALPNIYLNCMILLLIWKRKEFDKNNRLLVGFLMIWESVANFMDSIPSMGRFHYVIYPLLVYVWICNIEKLEKYRWMIYLIPIVYAYPLLYWFRNMVSISDISTYLTPLPYIMITNLF